VNIFASSSCPVESARSLDDKRVIKLILESTQMLSSARPELSLLKPAFLSHPATKWVRSLDSNYNWLHLHLCHLHREYHFRYGRWHSLLNIYELLVPLNSAPITACSPFPHLVRDVKRGLDFNHIPDVHLAYREYLKGKWTTDKRKPTWKKRGAPKWAIE